MPVGTVLRYEGCALGVVFIAHRTNMKGMETWFESLQMVELQGIFIFFLIFQILYSEHICFHNAG